MDAATQKPDLIRQQIALCQKELKALRKLLRTALAAEQVQQARQQRRALAGGRAARA